MKTIERAHTPKDLWEKVKVRLFGGFAPSRGVRCMSCPHPAAFEQLCQGLGTSEHRAGTLAAVHGAPQQTAADQDLPVPHPHAQAAQKVEVR